MSGAEAVIRSLEAAGVEICFGIPGGAILPIYDALAHSESPLQHILVRHEQGGGHMAQGYARATGKVGVAWATSGPGATNLVTPVADAFLDSTPMVVVTGQVPTHLIGTDAFQEADTTGIFMPIVKHSYLIQRRRRHHARASARRSTSPRPGGPGRCSSTCRRTSRRQQVTFHWPAEVDLPGYRPTRHGHPLQVQAAAEAIADAERPVLYVGGGIVNAEAHRRAARAGRGGARPGGHDADRQGRVPRLAPAVAADARHARVEVRELGAAPGRPADHASARASTTA